MMSDTFCYDLLLKNLEQCCFLDDPGGWSICLLFWSHPGAFDGLTCPHPRDFAIFLRKMLMPGGWPGGGGMGTAGID